jgi:mycothione reductase
MTAAKEFDVIVVGSGTGSTIVENALSHDLKVAWIDKGPLGGTCANVGCIPSKILIATADRVMDVQEGSRLGVETEITDIDFHGIMKRMHRIVDRTAEDMREGIRQTEGLVFYDREGRFVDTYTLEIGEERITGKKIFLASGARPLIPPIEGIENVPYLTNESVLQLDERPESVIIIGGGYIGAEYGHFLAAMGTQVTILQLDERLVPDEEPEISELLQQEMGRRMEIHTGAEAVAIEEIDVGIRVVAKERESGKKREFSAEHALIAAGRKSNADLLQVERAGIETDDLGYIVTDEHLTTNIPNIWAFGDANGKAMFTHAGNREASIVSHNALHDDDMAMSYRVVPHAIFSRPQIASVGLTEAEVKAGGHDFLIGEARYIDVAKGQAIMEWHGFAKAIIEANEGTILGFHIIGPYASILIQEVINVMAIDGTIEDVSNGMHIHPAMPELVLSTLYNLREPD